MRHTLRSLAATSVAAFLLTGCKPSLYLETPPAIAVEPVTYVLLLKGRPGRSLARAEANQLVDFLRTASGGRADAIHVTVVGMRSEARRAVIKTALWVGVAPHNLRELEDIADDRLRFAVRIVAVRYHAHPPVCPSLEVTGPSPNDNDFEPTLGCSNLANLAAMANDPKDLVGNTAVPPVDGDRAALPVAGYRTFGGAPSSNARSGTTSATPGNQAVPPPMPRNPPSAGP